MDLPRIYPFTLCGINHRLARLCGWPWKRAMRARWMRAVVVATYDNVARLITAAEMHRAFERLASRWGQALAGMAQA